MATSPAAESAQDYSFLDEREFRSRHAFGPEQNRMRFYVGGISCAKCVRKLEELPQAVPGLRQLRIEMGENLAHVEMDPQQASFSHVATHIRQLGYQPIPMLRETGGEEVRRQEDRRELIRLAVGGACAGNIMTFALAGYFGAGEWTAVFAWLSFALYLPVLFYVSVPFYRGAWSSWRRREISIDLPMTVASIAGFVFSTVEMWRGHTDFYFDSLSGFLFLILISRWAQKRMQRRFLRPQELAETLQLQRVRVLEPGKPWRWRPLDRVMVGEMIRMGPSETVPVDGELLSESGQFNLAWLSGEAKPRVFLNGSVVPAGSRLVRGEVDMRVKRTLPNTGFGQILAEVQKFSLVQNRVVLDSDRWAQWLLMIVFAVGLGFLAWHWHISPEEAIQRSLALIILACPCAMAFGTPLALAASLRQAQRAGLVVRDANVFDRARQVKTIFFDKTGTLTDVDLLLETSVTTIASVYQKVILALENPSAHPIAFALRKALHSSGSLPPVDGWRETMGVGVSGFIYGKRYDLRRSTGDGTKVSCALFEDDRVIVELQFGSEPKADVLSTLRLLRRQGRRIILLSGDHKASVSAMAKTLEFAPEDVHSGVTPEGKARLVASAPHSMMVGDGVNDSLAFIQAEVGVAISGGMEVALKSAQVYIAADGIRGVTDLLRISENAMALIKQNLTISVIYNSVGGALALSGYVSPLVAAVLMPLSSGFILLSTWLGGRE